MNTTPPYLPKSLLLANSARGVYAFLPHAAPHRLILTTYVLCVATKAFGRERKVNKTYECVHVWTQQRPAICSS